ncbi:MAG: hypothetical protein H6744_13410 [Deltaproteobacteria bacterium]|nr:hypothetical protein [Deltaproteobacteria bacterium]
MKICEVYERRGRMLVQASSQTDQGVWILQGDVHALPSDCTDEELGSVVLAALAQSSRVPHPTSWGGLTAALLAAAGVKSWKTFAKTAKNVSVELDQSGTIKPSRNLGPVDGFEPLPGQELAVPSDASAATWGRAVRGALEASTV